MNDKLQEKENELTKDDTPGALIAWDLDGIFMRNLPAKDYEVDLQATLFRRHWMQPFMRVPAIDAGTAVIVTERPAGDASRTRRWWERHFTPVPLHFRNESRYGTSPQEIARYKAETALTLGATLFIESNLHIAALMATQAPALQVRWFNRELQRAVRVAGWQAGHAQADASRSTAATTS